MLKNYKVNIFEKTGYLKINDALAKDLIEQSQKDLEKIKKFCQNKNYNYIRVYEDYSERINISGIENIFHESIINQNLVTILEKSDVINIIHKAKDLYHIASIKELLFIVLFFESTPSLRLLLFSLIRSISFSFFNSSRFTT